MISFFDVDYKYVGCVYKNQTNNFKLQRNESHIRWKIILGGWYGSRSLIESMNTQSICTTKDHSTNDFNTLKENFEVIVANESITIKNHENGEIFMACSNNEISKANLSHMSLSSGPWNVYGELQIAKIKGLPELDIYSTEFLHIRKYHRTIFHNNKIKSLI